MAKFDPVWKATDNFEAGYQNMPADAGNYCPAKGKAGSQLIGTNHGTSAIGYAQYFGTCPTVSQMKALPESTSKAIAKKQYWDQVQGDKINSQAIAHLIFDITYGGSSGPLQVRQAINAIKGKGTVSEFTSFTLSDKEVDLINSIPEKTFFNKLVSIRKNWLIGNTYQEGLTNRINKLVNIYASTLKEGIATVNKHFIPITIISLVIATGIFLIIYNKNK